MNTKTTAMTRTKADSGADAGQVHEAAPVTPACVMNTR
jgi:hypothetical protein